MTKHRVRYSEEFKGKAVSKVLTEGVILTRTAAEMGIPKSVLSKWVTKAKKNREVRGGDAPDGPAPGTGQEGPGDYAVLEDRIKRLEHSLEALRRILETAYATKVQLQFPADMPSAR